MTYYSVCIRFCLCYNLQGEQGITLKGVGVISYVTGVRGRV